MEGLQVLDEPMDFITIEDGEEVTLNVRRWDLGKATTQAPWRAPGELRETRVLRLHVPEGEKEHFPSYWDVGSKRLVAQLIALLRGFPGGSVSIKIRAQGTGFDKHFQVSVVP